MTHQPEIQTEELHATISRLKAEHEAMLLKHVREQNVALELLDSALKEIARLQEVVKSLSDHGCAAERMEFIKAQGTEIERLRALCLRAADALETIEAAQHWQWTKDLAAQLRKAAQ